MNFVFVSCSKNKEMYRNDPSFIYRCENLAYNLEKIGHSFMICHISELFLLNNIDVIVFHRPTYSLKLHFICMYTKVKKIVCIVDVDDLIFDVNYAQYSPAYRNGIWSLKKVQSRFQNTLKAFKLFSYFSVSTVPLREHLKKIISNSKIIIIPNSIHYSWKDKKIETYSSKNIKKITYFPGTKSHDKDFSTIAEPLTSFLKKHPDIQLHITGPLNFKLDLPDNQIFHKEKVIFKDYYKNFEGAWINLAPLEKTKFNECKSALKVIEAGHWGIPTICSFNDDIFRFRDAGAQIALNEDDWLKKLEYYNDEANYSIAQEKIAQNFNKLTDLISFSKDFTKFLQKRRFELLKNSIMAKYFTKTLAKKFRNRGLYNYETLWFYKKLWLKNKTANNFLEYVLFRRDLGYILSKKNQYLLSTVLDKLGYKQKEKALLLLKEVELKYFYNKNYVENINWLERVKRDQDSLYIKFKEQLEKSKENGICVVGNSAILNNSKLGKIIDKKDFVIRFNQCFKNDVPDNDSGKKLDVWVSAPNYDKAIQNKANWILLSGPDVLYLDINVKRFNTYIEQGGNLLSVPLDIWKQLVKRLQAPPSAGILTLYWIKEILGSWEGVSFTGFDLSLFHKQYHHADPNHLAGQRHNWEEEKRLLIEWKSKGLELF